MSSARHDLDLGILSMQHQNGEVYMVDEVQREDGEYWCHLVHNHIQAETPYGFMTVELLDSAWTPYGGVAEGFIR